MQRHHREEQLNRISLYGNATMVARLVEGRTAAGLFVELDAPAALRGRTIFGDEASAAAFVAQLDRHLTAGGFTCLWRTEERRAVSRDVPPEERRTRPQAGAISMMSEDWVHAHHVEV